MKVLLIVVNVDWFFISHRLQIGKEAVKNGWKVYVAAENTGRADEITREGIEFVNFTFSRSGTNLLNEFETLVKFYKLYTRLKPDIVHHVTLKPVVYGSIAARILKVKGVLNAIAGLGYNFTGERKGVVFKLILRLMKFGFNHPNLAVIFQNTDDLDDLKKIHILNEKNTIIFTKGSGVDLNKFGFTPLERDSSKRIKILFPTRMLWDKGVKELRAASEILKEKYADSITFVLAGMADNENREGVPASYLEDWEDGEYIKWIGYQKDMVRVYQDSDIVTLPSFYREGMPKSLIEACAIGRPIVTTDSTGCRECVDHGSNGFIVSPRSSSELAEALEKLILDEELRIIMGLASRNKAEKEFGVDLVVGAHLDIYRTLNEK